MTAALFLADFDEAVPGQVIVVTGDEARHAGAVKRIEPGEEVLLSNGRGLGARGIAESVTKTELRVRVEQTLAEPARRIRVAAVQALAKGERSELAVQMLTELGASRIVAWQADRSIVRWQGERGDKALAKWRSTARESAKQARRFAVPEVSAATSRQLVAALADQDLVLVLHEDADLHIADIVLPEEGCVAVVIGPEGGITGGELDALLATGAKAVRISDGVLRTSTAGAVALAQLEVLAR
ncbi:MAG TPA: 16S rRNA (uracil(1498)-N(3))-methyltransferase [Arachnia sp.]|nr:16S rRNA (uracil(1498)-N(3))-methyltransferase [Arachnia sp.]HMT87527.1 16S rRNA (uracil(1498)-N(3))-methyltransferase [Arachnia sp.]